MNLSPRHPQLSRRQLLHTWCAGFGGLALNAMLLEQGLARGTSRPADPLAPRSPHFAARARSVILLFMHGGTSTRSTPIRSFKGITASRRPSRRHASSLRSAALLWLRRGASGATAKKGHERNAAQIDFPVAGLLKDLKSRGLLDETLVLWGGEFGRTPTAQGKDGRDHHPNGFTMWMAGGGVKGGYRHGETDEYGYYAVRDRVNIHDLHATILHLMGLDHEKLTYQHDGREFRLTDVYGNVVKEILA